MLPDPVEFETLAKLTAKFTEAYEDVIEQIRHMAKIYLITKRAEPKPPAVDVRVIVEEAQPCGKFCPACQSTKVIIKGAGCMKCMSCGFDLGCGG